MATHEECVRRALLERLAGDLAIIAEPYRYHWTCCWLDYERQGISWSYQICGGRMPGHFMTGQWTHCGHWHHRTEVFLAPL